VDIVTRSTVVQMNVEVLTKYPLSQNNKFVVLKYASTAKTICSGNQCSTVTEMFWVTLESALKDNVPMSMFHSQLRSQSIWFLCFTSYKEVQLKSIRQHTRTWPTATWPPCHLCYHPAVFFCHPSHLASNHITEVWSTFQFFFLNFWNIK